jgi:nitrite reductase/ring-hydroxylating ferredoxin subunit
VRNRAGELKAFHNVCRHRCLQLVDKLCNVGHLLRCRYHSWTYTLDGELKLTPYYDAFTKDGLTLNAGVYGSTFFLLTGFHGVHVLIETIMLLLFVFVHWL